MSSRFLESFIKRFVLENSVYKALHIVLRHKTNLLTGNLTALDCNNCRNIHYTILSCQIRILVHINIVKLHICGQDRGDC